MSAVLSKPDVLVSAEELLSVRHDVETALNGITGFAAIMSDGETRALSPELSKVIGQAIETLAVNGSVSVGSLPDELTSNTAADVLGVSRPRLLKLAQAGDVPSFKIGSHTRFKRADILNLKAKRESARNEAMMELLEIREELENHK